MNDKDFPQTLYMNHSNSSTPSTAIHNGCRTGLQWAAVIKQDCQEKKKKKKTLEFYSEFKN